MSFSPEWDERYRANTHMSIWPWSDLVSYVMRYAKPSNPSQCRVLELGCGAGANIPFFKWLGVDYHAVDGSPAIVKKLQQRYPGYAEKIKAADFTSSIPFDVGFDIIVDRASLTHNDTESIRRGIALLRDHMIPGSYFIGIDWFSVNHTDFSKGNPDADGYTRHAITDGQFAGVGSVHFSDQSHIVALFEGFDIRTLEEKRNFRVIPKDGHVFASWNFLAVRR